MTRFYSPYQFIPFSPSRDETSLTEYDKIKAGELPFVRHDRWDKDSFSGRIVCRLTTISPLVIGVRQEQPDEEEPATVIPYAEGQRLPANSLRGMIASVTESISNSAMRVLSKREAHEYAVRKAMRNSLKAIGLLRKDDQGWYITPLALSALRLTNNQLPQKWQKVFSNLHLKECLAHYVGFYPSDNDKWAQAFNTGRIKTYQHEDNPTITNYNKASCTNKKVNEKLFPNDGLNIHKGTLKPKHLTQEGITRGMFFISGGNEHYRQMPRKKHELFIPWPSDLNARNRLPVKPGLVGQFNSLLVSRYKDTKHEMPFMPIGYEGRFHDDHPQVVKSGDLVYFDVEISDDELLVTELSYSAIWRRPVGNLYDSLEQIDKNLLPWNGDRKYLTPAEALFGVIEKSGDGGTMDKTARNLASRLRFHDARAESEVTLPEETILLKILASPKPPSPSMYFHDPQRGYISKQKLDLRKHKPNGRKRYLPHPEWNKNGKGNKKWVTGHDQENRKQKLYCCPIPDNTSYWFHIDFENLSENELDLLRRAITPAPDKEFQHQLGLGKPLGLGQVKVEEIGVFLIDRKSRYGLEGISKPRYAKAHIKPNEQLASIYAQEKNAENQENWLALKEAEQNPLLDGKALQILRQIGLPNQYMDADIPVCYPFHSTQNRCEETEGFVWYVNNEKSERPQFLSGIKERHKLPTLDSNTETWQEIEPTVVDEDQQALRLGGLLPKNQRDYEEQDVQNAIEKTWPGSRVKEINLGKSQVVMMTSPALKQSLGNNEKVAFSVTEKSTLTLRQE